MPYSRTSPQPSPSKSNMSSSGDEQNLTKEEKKRRKAEKKERKKEKKAAKKRKRDSVESAASAATPTSTNGGAKKKSKKETGSSNNNGGGGSNAKSGGNASSGRARTNSVASVHTHHSVTEDTITERIGANVSSRVVSGDSTGSSATSGVRGAAGGVGAASAGSSTVSRDNAELLPYRVKKVRSLVSLAPSSLSDVKGNIRRLSCQDVTRYVKGLEGVLMAVREVKVCGPGRVQNELAHVHYQVEADVVVFCPDVGTRLVGVVNESFPSHVGMLVDTLFNAMVPAEELRRLGYEYDMDSNQWSTERDVKTGELLPSPLPISVDDRIGFTVSKLNELNGIISLEGDDADMQGAEP